MPDVHKRLIAWDRHAFCLLQNMKTITTLAAVMVSAGAHAVPITYNFTGTVTTAAIADEIRNQYVPGLEVGAQFGGALLVDPEHDPDRAWLWLNVEGTEIVTNLGAARFTVENDGPSGDSVVYSQPGGQMISEFVDGIGYFRSEAMMLRLQDVTGAALSTDQLPDDLASLFPERTFEFLGFGICEEQLCGVVRNFSIRWEGQIDMLAVPEPETILLLSSVLAGLAFTRRRARR